MDTAKLGQGDEMVERFLREYAEELGASEEEVEVARTLLYQVDGDGAETDDEVIAEEIFAQWLEDGESFSVHAHPCSNAAMGCQKMQNHEGPCGKVTP